MDTSFAEPPRGDGQKRTSMHARARKLHYPECMRMRQGTIGPAALAAFLSWSVRGHAQAAFPPEAPPQAPPAAAPQPPPPAPPAANPPPPAAPVAPAPASAPAAAPVAPAAQTPAPQGTAPAPPSAAPAPSSAPPAPQPVVYEPPPPPPKKPDADRDWPELSIRIDPLNWLLDGRLGIELETQVYKFISFEMVPVFVTSELPPNLRWSADGIVTQESNGVGALSGTSVGAGFWLSGKALRGTVFRVILTNYSYTYKASDEAGTFDSVSHVDRHAYAYLGGHSRWGLFTLAGGIGLGVELNKEQRCLIGGRIVTSGCRNEELDIAMDRTWARAPGNLHSSTYPIEVMFRLSLGVTF